MCYNNFELLFVLIFMMGWLVISAGDVLKCQWRQYRDANIYIGTIENRGAEKQEASFTVPDDAGQGDAIHIICEATDTGMPPLMRYRRVVMTIERYI